MKPDNHEAKIGSMFTEDGSLDRPVDGSTWHSPYWAEVRGERLCWGYNSDFGKTPEAPMTGPMVTATKGMIEQFIFLRSAPDENIRSFALKWGMLGLWEHQLQDGPLSYYEQLSQWRAYSAMFYGLLSVANRLRDGKPGLLEDWQAIYSQNQTDPTAPLSISRGGLKINRIHLRECLTELIRLGNVGVSLDWPSDAKRGRLRFDGRGLFGSLVLQLILAINGSKGAVHCYHCEREYAPLRAPKARCRNFCPDCRDAGIPTRYSLDAFREREERKRAARKGDSKPSTLAETLASPTGKHGKTREIKGPAKRL